MKLATTTGDFCNYTDSQIEALRLIKESGFKYADYNFHVDYRRKDGIYRPDYPKYFNEVARAAERIGITLVQAHAPMGDPIEEDNRAFIEDTVRCVEASAAWGIKNLVVHSGYLEGISVEKTFEKNKEFFTSVLEHAEKYGVNILVENFNKMCLDNYFWIDNATDLLAFVKYVDHPLLHAVWDTGHANLQDMPQHEEISLLGNEIKALHVQDNGGEWDQHLMPFFGTMNMDSLMNGLLDIGYDGYFTFEVGDPFTKPENKRAYSADNRLAKPPLELKLAFEKCLFELGKATLCAYGVYEE